MKNSLKPGTRKRQRDYEIAAKQIYFPVIGYTVTVVVTEDLQSSRNFRNSLIGHEYTVPPPVNAFHSFNTEKGKSWVFFKPHPTAGTVGHECCHAVTRMFQWIGAENECELFAYHLGYLIDECMAILYPTKK